VLRWYSEI